MREYLNALCDYAVTVVPGLEMTSKPISLEKIFVEPLLRERYIKHADSEQREERNRESPSIPALKSLGTDRLVVIVGEPGQGKSTLLRQYACVLAKDQRIPRFPLLVELGREPRKVEDGHKDFRWLYDRVPDYLKASLDTNLWDNVCKALRAGRGAVLLDAYDEISDDA